MEVTFNATMAEMVLRVTEMESMHKCVLTSRRQSMTKCPPNFCNASLNLSLGEFRDQADR
jgi:hypothetical protein